MKAAAKNERKVGRPAAAGTITAYVVMLGVMLAVVWFLIPETPPDRLAGLVPASWFRLTLTGLLAVLFLLTALLHWRTIRGSLFRTSAAQTKPTAAQSPVDSVKTGPSEKQIRQHRDRKLYLHLLSILQTEGRFLDFLNEDLGSFDDASIGAAARGVHEKCRRALEKHLTLQAVVDEKEGMSVSIDPRREPGRYRLKGRVTGEPPFQGVVSHPGWRVKTLNMPDFSFSDETDIIAPAVVDVQ